MTEAYPVQVNMFGRVKDNREFMEQSRSGALQNNLLGILRSKNETFLQDVE